MRRFAIFAAAWLAAFAVADAALAQYIIAHRGASYDAPENTLAAFNLAWEQGADGIEGDFYLTSDQQVICCHDKDTQRTSGVMHVVKDTAFEVLRALDVGAWKHQRYQGERMPTFEEVAATVPKGKFFFIELKTGPEIVAPLKKHIDAAPLKREQMIIISFDADAIAECERQMPDLKTYWLTGYKEKQGRWTPTRDEVAAELRRSHADGFGSQARMEVLNKAFLSGLCPDGPCDFHVWTVDEAKPARFYRRLGAWSITTNRPARLRAQLAKKPQPAAVGN